MITYPISSNICKKNYLQCYWLYNFSSFRSSQCMSSVRKGVLGKVSFLIKLQAEGTASDLSHVFSCWNKVTAEAIASDLSRVFFIEDFLFISFQQKNEMKKGKLYFAWKHLKVDYSKNIWEKGICGYGFVCLLVGYISVKKLLKTKILLVQELIKEE